MEVLTPERPVLYRNGLAICPFLLPGALLSGALLRNKGVARGAVKRSRPDDFTERSPGVKQETLISVTILTVVTVVVIGVWTSGFGLFKHSSSALPAGLPAEGSAAAGAMSPLWGAPTPPGLLRPPPSAVNGFLLPGAAPGGMVAAAVPGEGMPGGMPGGMIEGVIETVAPKAPNFIPDSVQIYEAHWQGMDVRLLTAELRRKLRYPQQLEGILVGEVTMNAARSGLLGGDVIIAVEGQAVKTLEAFQEATRAVAASKQATLGVLRKTGPRNQLGNRAAMIRLTLVLVDSRELGFAQVEGAPMIKPGDPRPHPDRGPCTQCHAVGTGFELTPDPDLITLPPPALSREIVAKGFRPHEDRGPCQACHIVTP
ncbi:PDZ domain-containing protein [Azospirillaceae bacterium]|nr:hypothetical protein MTCCP1_00031 [uncultured bacterium]